MKYQITSAAAALLIVSGSAVTPAHAVVNEPEMEVDGKYFDGDGFPTYQVDEDGTVDWHTYSGFRRYHADCHVCHGPDGLGSSFGPALADSLSALDYPAFLQIVAAGRENITSAQQNKMPSFGHNPNVMCFIDDIYIYLRARADDAIPRGRPAKKDPKTDEARASAETCMGSWEQSRAAP